MKSSIPIDRNSHSLVRYSIAVASLTAVGLAISWMVRDALLLIFAGLLFASFLDAMTDLLGKAISWPRGVRLSIVCAIIAASLLAFAAWGGATIAMQGQELAENLQDQINHLLAWLSDLGLKVSPASRSGLGTPKIPNAEPTIRSVLPDISVLFGQAWTAVGVLLGAVGDALVIIIIGLFVAIRPAVYLNAALLLIPPTQRNRYKKLLNECGETIRNWLIGQALTMVLIGVFVWLGLVLAGVEPALILGLQAGLLAFVPTLGPLLAGVIIVLASLASGVWGIVGALCVYLGVQALESYILTPIIQKRAISVPPAFLFAGQIVLGILFGLYGLALAAPLSAIIRVFFLRLYPTSSAEEQP